MNELFKNGDYVLLEDCKAFDEKFGLEEGATMWAVARKLEGGEPKGRYMTPRHDENRVGIDFDGDVGVWLDLDERGAATKLTVEDVLYRSKDGLTLDELSKIHGAFEEGKKYKCVVGTSLAFTKGNIYKANGEGITANDSYSTTGYIAKFKPVTKAEWVPKVGDLCLCLLEGKWFKCEILKFNNIGAAVVLLVDDKLNERNIYWSGDFKPIDHERKRIINKAYSVMKTSKISNTQKKTINKLYDAGMLKEGDE